MVLPDADLPLAIKGSLFSGLMNNGQTCVSTTRILLPADRYEEAVELATEYTRQLVVGDPADMATDVGPLIGARRRRSRPRRPRPGAGGQSDCGRRDSGRATGVLLPTTILRDVTPEMDIARREISARYRADRLRHRRGRDPDRQRHRVRIRGLAVWGADVAQAAKVADRLVAGLKWIDGVGQIDVAATPMAGRRSSGLGVELGPEGLLAYTLPASTYTSGGRGGAGRRVRTRRISLGSRMIGDSQ